MSSAQQLYRTAGFVQTGTFERAERKYFIFSRQSPIHVPLV